MDTGKEPLLNCHQSETSQFNSEKKSPYDYAGIFSLISFSWLSPLLSLGYKKALHLNDIPPLANADTAEAALGALMPRWKSLGPPKRTLNASSLLKCLALTHWKLILVSAAYAVIYTCSSYVGPYLVNDFVDAISGRGYSSKQCYILVGVFFLAKLTESLSHRHWSFGVQQMGSRIRAALMCIVYTKGLKLSRQSQQKHSAGEVMNVVGVDVQRVGDFCIQLHNIWLFPLHITLSVSILYLNLGIASLAAFLATAFTVVANLPLSKLQKEFQVKIMEGKDARMKATAEVLKCMRILKLQAWEMRFLRKIEDLRNVEYKWLSRFLYTRAAALGLFWGAPILVSLVTFTTCMLMDIPLTTGKVLSALATMRIMQDPMRNLPDLVSILAQTKVSIDRISTFLSEEELQPDAVDRFKASIDGSPPIEFRCASFSSDGDNGSFNLEIPDLQIWKDSKVAVCGTVGSGKSSFLSCILGDIPKLAGTLKVYGTVAYVPQSAWIQTGKVVDNILFGNAMDQDRYKTIIHACALEKDLELFSHGDQTEIGERGINLSGGQKQRIQLARALYQDADIYLLDDPFSAVDAHTGTHLFKECIMNVLATKTVIYVTHQIEFLSVADVILVFQDGKVVERGNYNDLQLMGTRFLTLADAHEESLKAFNLTDYGDKSMDLKYKLEMPHLEEIEFFDQIMKDDKELEGNKDMMAQIVDDEERQVGRVGASVYWALVSTAYRGALAPVILTAQVMFQCLQIASNYWIAWATPNTSSFDPIVSIGDMLIIYSILAFGSTICIIIRTLSTAAVTVKTGQAMFMKMHHSIFHAAMSFLDSTPNGRILNRASKDQAAVDLEVSIRFETLIFCFVNLLGAVIVMTQAAWELLILVIPALSICIWLQCYYIASARELARLTGICISPVLQHFGETISGATVIRGFKKQEDFMNKNVKLVDDYCRPLFYNFAAMEWLSFRLDLLTNCVFTLCLLIIVTLPEGTIDPSISGLAVTYGLNINVIQSWVTWNLCNLENRIISVERIQQYMDIPSEAPLIIESCRPPNNWPSDGTIDLIGLKVRYGQRMPLVLHGLTCTFLGGETVGIVGRTGSGKSTLVQSLFRLVEPSEGIIVIDGINISGIGLHDLRSRLSIIPQDPVMFEGTIRSNLDPLEEHAEIDIWKALQRCQLEEVVRTKDKKLDAIVFENGENWSVGQRQLLCLGRVLLKKSQILILDEATASVDSATDMMIQETLKTEFPNQTVIAIAHRIATVVNSDMVLVLNEGRIAEYDKPSNLLDAPSTLFSKLVAEFYQRSRYSSN